MTKGFCFLSLVDCRSGGADWEKYLGVRNFFARSPLAPVALGAGSGFEVEGDFLHENRQDNRPPLTSAIPLEGFSQNLFSPDEMLRANDSIPSGRDVASVDHCA